MDKFIKWMKYKEYCSITKLSKQALIGYMLEYLMERYSEVVGDVNNYVAETIESFYDILYENIEELNNAGTNKNT